MMNFIEMLSARPGPVEHGLIVKDLKDEGKLKTEKRGATTYYIKL